MVDHDVGILVRICPENARLKQFYLFKTGRLRNLETHEYMRVGDFFDFKASKKHREEGVIVETSGDVVNPNIFLKDLPLLIRPKGQAHPAWSPFVGIVEQIHPSYKQLHNQVLLVQLDWVPRDNYWRLFNIHSKESGLDPDEFAAEAPWVPPPAPPEEPKPRHDKDYYEGVVFRFDGIRAVGAYPKGVFEVSASAHNRGRNPMRLGSFVHIRLAKGKNERGYRVVTEYCIVNYWLEWNTMLERKTNTAFRVKTVINNEGEFDIEKGHRLYYGKSDHLGKCYDLYDFPNRKISNKTRGLLEVWVIEVPKSEPLRLQVLHMRHLSDRTRPPRNSPTPPLIPPPPLPPKPLTGIINLTESGNVLYCPEKRVEYPYPTENPYVIGNMVSFKLSENSITPYEILPIESKFQTRFLDNGDLEIKVACIFKGEMDDEGFPVLECGDLGMNVRGFKNSNYGHSLFEHWVIRTPGAEVRWEVSPSNPVFSSSSTSIQKRISCFYVGEVVDGQKTLFCEELNQRIFDTQGVISKPGEYTLWATQLNGSQWQISDTAKPPKLEEEYPEWECALLTPPPLPPVDLDEAFAALRQAVRLPEIQDAIIANSETAGDLIDLFYINPDPNL